MKLARLALGLDNAVNYHWSALPGLAGPLWRYFLNSAPARHRAFSQHYARLVQRSLADHAPLIAAALKRSFSAKAIAKVTGRCKSLRWPCSMPCGCAQTMASRLICWTPRWRKPSQTCCAPWLGLCTGHRAGRVLIPALWSQPMPGCLKAAAAAWLLKMPRASCAAARLGHWKRR